LSDGAEAARPSEGSSEERLQDRDDSVRREAHRPAPGPRAADLHEPVLQITNWCAGSTTFSAHFRTIPFTASLPMSSSQRERKDSLTGRVPSRLVERRAIVRDRLEVDLVGDLIPVIVTSSAAARDDLGLGSCGRAASLGVPFWPRFRCFGFYLQFLEAGRPSAETRASVVGRGNASVPFRRSRLRILSANRSAR